MFKQKFGLYEAVYVLLVTTFTMCVAWHNEFSYSQMSSQRIVNLKRNTNEESKERAMFQPRIVGGRPARWGEAPYQVRILLRGEFHCGGAILNHCGLRFVITAGHCVWEQLDNSSILSIVPFDKVEIIAADLKRSTFEPHEKWFSPASIAIHPEFDPRFVLNDIALIRLEQYMFEGAGLEHIGIPGAAWREPAYCRVSGWGSNNHWGGHNPDDLQIAEVPVYPWDDCRKLPHASPWVFLTKNQFCLGNKEPIYKGICDGDSGGPAIAYNWTLQKWYLAGISSMVINLVCGDQKSASTFTKLSDFAEWIFDVAQKWLEKYGTGNPYNNRSLCIPD